LSWGRKLLAAGAAVVLSVTVVGSGSATRSTGGDWGTWQKDLAGPATRRPSTSSTHAMSGS